MSLLTSKDSSLEELLEFLLDSVAKHFKKVLYPRKYFDRLRQLDTSSEKLIYLFLLVAQPQTFSSTHKLLSLSQDTVASALNALLKRQFVAQDETFLYWILE